MIGLFGSLCDFAALSNEDVGTCPVAGGHGLANWNTIWNTVQAWAKQTYPPNGFEFIFQWGDYGRPDINLPTGQFAWPHPAVWDHQVGNVSDGSQYMWCDNSIFDCDDGGYLSRFYDAGASNPEDLTVGVLDKGFDDTHAGWTKNRVTSQQCGKSCC